jgi:conjugal transfer pilus assembly protein TraB
MVDENSQIPPDNKEETPPPGDEEKPRMKLRDAIDRIKERRTTAAIVVLLAVGLVIGGIAFKDIYKAQKRTQEIQHDPKITKVLRLSKSAVQNEVASSEQLMESWQSILERKVNALEKSLADEQRKNEEYEEKLKKKTGGYPSTKLPPLVPGSATSPTVSQSPAMPTAPVTQNPPVASLPLPQGRRTPGKAVTTNSGVPGQTTTMPPRGSFRTIDFPKAEKKKEETAKLNEKNIDLPMGIAVGLTINGMDAPTFQQGQNDPQPLLASIETSLMTANNQEIDIKGCMVLASAHGSVSAEKAMPRLVRMNCRDSEGNLYSGTVRGWVLGDDGKVGITGRLVSRQGAVLAKSFWADIISLGGTFLRKAAENSTTSYSALGYITSTEDTPTSDLAKQAAGSAVERTTDRIAKFFIKIAEQIYPVVEIMPGRKVTMMVESGSLKRVDKNNFASLTGLNSTTSVNPTHTTTNNIPKEGIIR